MEKLIFWYFKKRKIPINIKGRTPGQQGNAGRPDRNMPDARMFQIKGILENIPHKAVDTKAPMSITPAYGPISNAGRQLCNVESEFMTMTDAQAFEEGTIRGK